MRFFISILLFVLAANTSLFAQNQNKYISLANKLHELEKKFKVTFSYANSQIEPISVQDFELSDSLEKNLELISTHSPYEAKPLEDRIIAFVLKKNYSIKCIVPIDASNQQIESKIFLYLNDLIIESSSSDEIQIPVHKDNNQFIRLEANGYEKTGFNSHQIEENNCLEVVLFTEPINLDEVIITNYLTKGIDKMKAGQIRFNPAYFGALPGLIEPDVLQSIQTLPGVMSTEESVSYLNIRGGTHDQNLFLWDGIKMYQTSHFFGMITSLNPYITQSTDIIKNASNPEFGDGVSSVINMKTSKKINKELKAEAGLNMIHADFFIDAPLNENSSLQITGRQSINQIAETPTYNRFFDKVFQNTAVILEDNETSVQDDEFSFYDFSFRWLYQISDRDFLRVNGLFTSNQFSLNRSETQGQQTATRESSLDQQTYAFGVFYERNWNTRFTSSIQLYTSNYNLMSTNTDLSFNQSLTQENQVQEWGFKIKNNFKFNEELNFYGGYQLNETGILNFENLNFPLFRRSVKEALFTNSIFSGLEFKPSSKTYLNIGARINHVTKFNQVLFEPRLNLSHRFLNHFIFEFQAEIKSQTTSQVIDQQSDFLGVENRRWVLANPNEIPIITSEQASVGIHYKNNNWLVTSDFYYKRVLDITSQSQGFQNQFQFQTTHGNYEVVGAEFLINKKWNRFSSWLSYTLSKNEYYFEDFSPNTFLNNIDIRHVLHYGLNYDYKGLNLATGLYWHSGLPTTGIIPTQDAEAFVFGDPNNNRLQNFFRIDLSANYHWKLNEYVKFYTGVSFWNLFGRQNFYNSFYQNNAQNHLEETFQQGLGFTPNFSLRLQF